MKSLKNIFRLRRYVKSSLVENFRDRWKYFVCGKLLWLWKNLCLWKTLLITDKSLVVEHFLHHGKIPCLQKIFLIVKKSLLVMNFLALLNHEKKVLWKTSFIMEHSLIMEKPLLVEYLLDHGKIFACGELSWSVLLKIHLFNKTNAIIETIKSRNVENQNIGAKS